MEHHDLLVDRYRVLLVAHGLAAVGGVDTVHRAALGLPNGRRNTVLHCNGSGDGTEREENPLGNKSTTNI